MKALLAAIKTQLQTDLTYVRDSDVVVVEDEVVLPEQTKFPAVGLKDGRIVYAIETQNQETDELEVDIIAYARNAKPEAAVMGDDATGVKGVLDVVADAKASLTNNTLSGQADVAIPVSEGASEILVVDDKTAVQMKKLRMRYKRYDVGV